MDTGKLKKFAQAARRELIQQTAGKLEQVLAEGSLARREQPRAVKDLEEQIQAYGNEELVERAAYIWFNRFTALRFMDANGYNQIMVVSPAEGQSQPAILAEAKQGHIDEKVVRENLRVRVFDLLDGRTSSRDAQGEAYRLLLVAVCNYWYQRMPFLFEYIADWTELLMPDDLLSDGSVRTQIRTVLGVDDCQDVEVIGWLYQFYISEKKDQVFAGLKKNQKITAENIPAATQLFTPHWIVRYLVENSLGRLWLLNRPESRLAERMDYYIAPEEPETEFLKIGKPEEIKVCDPACGSGHMLTYAFDLLYAIYEEEGYDPAHIPELILTHNLTGVEIDDRAGALAAFALSMKAAGKLVRRRFLRMEANPDIVVLQNVSFTPAEMQDVAAVVGKDLFTDELRETLLQFEQARNFGSLIVPKLRDAAETLRVVAGRDFGGDLLLKEVQERVVAVLQMAEALSPKYHVVVANPPYMGGTGMNSALRDFLKGRFKECSNDLYAAFMWRLMHFVKANGISGMMTPFTWMYLSSFEKLRKRLVEGMDLQSLVKPQYHTLFDSAAVPISAYCIARQVPRERASTFFDLEQFKRREDQAPRLQEAIEDRSAPWRFDVPTKKLKAVPGTPVAFSLSDGVLKAFATDRFGHHSKSSFGIKTGNNEKFLLAWHEVERGKTDLNADGSSFEKRWYPCASGGTFRRWYGNSFFVVDYEGQGKRIEQYAQENGNSYGFNGSRIYFKRLITWPKLTSSTNSFRATLGSHIFDGVGLSADFPDESDYFHALLAANSAVITHITPIIAPTMSLTSGDFDKLPFLSAAKTTREHAEKLIETSRSDWDAYETSWDFTTLPLLSPDHQADALEATYARLRAHWQGMTDEMQRLEEENNRIFIDAYGLQDELTPEVPIEEITLTCNPAYRYGVKGTEADRETRLRADTMAEFLSYAVGCMFGRYSLDAPGLILANQGETLEDYLARVPSPSFAPDEDNVIPILEDTWFTDDIVERFHAFLRVTFGVEHFQDNLAFIEQALGKPLRKYFLKNFYKDHVKSYKKRPIYWLFSSPKGSFNALIYMHRYRPDTVSVILNEYLREFCTKLTARVEQLEEIEASAASSARDKTAALKEISKLRAMIAELEDWERKVLLPLASEKIEIDLDDGVKANYPKFGAALAKVTGLSQ